MKQPREVVDTVPAFDLLYGTNQIRDGVGAGRPLQRLIEGFDEQANAFAARRRSHLLYGTKS
jgi:hypothetical protein